MTITADSPLIGNPSGTIHEAIVWAGQENAEYIREVWRLSEWTGLDPALIVAQWAHETADGTSPRWVNNRNPAGLGIEADSDADPATLTQTDAAQLHIWCLVFTVTKPLSAAFNLPQSTRAFTTRWMRKIEERNYPHPVETVADLQKRYVDSSGEPQAVWGWDERYASKLVAKHRAMFGAQEAPPVSESLVFGRVPYPAVTERHLPLGGWVKSGAPAVPEAVVWHRMIGTLWGTDGWFFGGNAATAYGIGVVSIDGADDAGRIIEWMDPASGYYGESSGPAKAPYGDGALFVERFGVSGVNRLTKAIEISGNYDTPLDEPARAAIVALTAYFADQRRIPWSLFPMVPDQGRSFVIWHQEFTGPAEKVCPGAVVMAETSALIARVRDVLKAAQTVTDEPKPPVYAAPELPDWWEAHAAQSWPSDADWNGLRFRVARRRAEALKPAVRRSRPADDAPKSGPNLLVREKVNVERTVQTEVVKNGKTKRIDWIVTSDGHYIRAASVSPRIVIAPR